MAARQPISSQVTWESIGPSDCPDLHPIPPEPTPAPERVRATLQNLPHFQDPHDVHICILHRLVSIHSQSNLLSDVCASKPLTRQGWFLSQRKKVGGKCSEVIETGRDHDSGP
jgi:hypothetical protein